MFTKNLNDDKLIGKLSKTHLELIRIGLKLIDKCVWPMMDFVYSSKARSWLNKLQELISKMRILEKSKSAMELVEYYCFSLVIRIFAIDSVLYRESNLNTINVKISKSMDYATAFSLLRESHPKFICCKSFIKSKFILREGYKSNYFDKKNKIGRYIVDILDKVIQYQFNILLEPYYGMLLPKVLNGNYKYQSSLQAITKLKYSLEYNDLNKTVLVILDILNSFDNFTHDLIFADFDFPVKYKLLLVRWLKAYTYDITGNLTKTIKGIPKDTVMGNLIYNVLLNKILNKVLNNNKFPKYITIFNIDGSRRCMNLNRNVIGYLNDIIISVCSVNEAKYCLKKIEKTIKKYGLILNKKKSKIVDLSIKSKVSWDFLGYTFLSIPSNIVNLRGFLSKKKNKIVTYISDNNYKEIKKKLKIMISRLCYKDLYDVMIEVNKIIKGVIIYYPNNFINNPKQLKYLDTFVDRCYWRHLIKKYRYRGLRRTGWVAKTFFISKISPIGIKWHLHSYMNYKLYKNCSDKILWCNKAYIRLSKITIKIIRPPKYLLESLYINKYLYKLYISKKNQKKIITNNWLLY